VSEDAPSVVESVEGSGDVGQPSMTRDGMIERNAFRSMGR
jgi:hypothetical protein